MKYLPILIFPFKATLLEFLSLNSDAFLLAEVRMHTKDERIIMQDERIKMKEEEDSRHMGVFK